ncbi:hypothetical protein L2E82_02674 [Cichorium intybus]|uniref:Uncharacterized protein n=1 Tax=Cichorium intybus TaxID=13427 RepID=A0ACB9H2B6_CICIN|nr:hypothetical protein L2E82_02674 [Cichorium intybus]
MGFSPRRSCDFLLLFLSLDLDSNLSTCFWTLTFFHSFLSSHLPNPFLSSVCSSVVAGSSFIFVSDIFLKLFYGKDLSYAVSIQFTEFLSVLLVYVS